MNTVETNNLPPVELHVGDHVKLQLLDMTLSPGCALCLSDTNLIARLRLRTSATVLARICADCAPPADASEEILDQFERRLLLAAN